MSYQPRPPQDAPPKPPGPSNLKVGAMLTGIPGGLAVGVGVLFQSGGVIVAGLVLVAVCIVFAILEGKRERRA